MLHVEYVQTTVSRVQFLFPPPISKFWFHNLDQKPTRASFLWVSCALCTAGGVMGIQLWGQTASCKEPLQCINWIIVRPENLLCLKVLAITQGGAHFYKARLAQILAK